MAAARCDALCGASGLTCSGRKRGSMPLTASKTEDDTKAATRLLTSGLLPPAMTVVFMTPIHSSTGSGAAAAAAGRGLSAMPLNSKAQIVAIPKRFLVDMGSLLWGERESRIAQARCQWTEAEFFP